MAVYWWIAALRAPCVAQVRSVGWRSLNRPKFPSSSFDRSLVGVASSKHVSAIYQSSLVTYVCLNALISSIQVQQA
eukprot:5237504-Amphidinium_carterae.1